MTRTIRQGDVFVIPATIPTGTRPVARDNGRLILAYGEATGHSHRIEEIEGCEVYELDGKVYLRITADVPLLHEEHKHPVPISPGEYEVVQQCEELAGDIRQVAD